MKTVIVVDDEPITRMDIRAMLTGLGYDVKGEAGDGLDAVELCRRIHPDVVVMDVKMPVFDGLSASETILSEELAGCVVLLTAFNDDEIIERAKKIGVGGYISKPVNERLIKPIIELAIAQGEKLRESRSETEEARKKLSDSRMIHLAQSILARNEQISEGEAYQILRKLSMDKHMPMVRLAERIIEEDRMRRGDKS